MKRLASLFVVILMFLVIAILLGVGIITIPKLINKHPDGASQLISKANTPIGDNPASSYPPPRVTPTIASKLSMESGTSYPAPKDNLPRSATALPTVRATRNPMTPVPPPDWPADLPWPPPTRTQQGSKSVSPITYPTLKFQLLDSQSADAGLPRFGYLYHAGQDAPLIFEQITVNNKGFRMEKPFASVSLGISGNQQLSGLYLSPDGKKVAIGIFYGGATNSVEIVDLLVGKSLSLLRNTKGQISQFFDWSPNSNQILVHINDQLASIVAQLDLITGERKNIEYAQWDGAPPEVQGMVYSPDGSLITDAVFYPRVSGKSHPWTAEIGYWKRDDHPSRQVLCQFPGVSVYPDTLRWSPDGQRVLWIAGEESSEKSGGAKLILWMSDFQTKSCKKVTDLGFGTNFSPDGFNANWSPDGKKVVFPIKEATSDGSTLYHLGVLDMDTGNITSVTKPSQAVLTVPQFSPDGNMIVYGIAKEGYGEIWGTNLDGSQSYPLAGPTTTSAMFEWIINK